MRKLLLLILTLVCLYACSADSDHNQENASLKEKNPAKIDSDLEKLQTELPLDYGNEWIHTVARRDDHTVIFEYAASRLYKGGYDHAGQRMRFIKLIQANQELLSSQLEFKVTYKFPDGNSDSIKVSPEDYNIE